RKSGWRCRAEGGESHVSLKEEFSPAPSGVAPGRGTRFPRGQRGCQVTCVGGKDDFMSANITVTVDTSNSSLKGTTLYVEEPPAKGGHRTDTGGCITPTAVYIAPNHDQTKNLNIILWFHGHHVKDYQKN